MRFLLQTENTKHGVKVLRSERDDAAAIGVEHILESVNFVMGTGRMMDRCLGRGC